MSDQLKRDLAMYPNELPSFEEYKVMRAQQLPPPGKTPVPAPSIWKQISTALMENPAAPAAKPAEIYPPGKTPVPGPSTQELQDSLNRSFKFKK